jgi:exodeoxyribonuclease VII small subunit
MAKKSELSYAAAMAEIEQILGRFRKEELSVDDLTKEVKRATELISLCKERLLKAEQSVKKVLEE